MLGGLLRGALYCLLGTSFTLLIATVRGVVEAYDISRGEKDQRYCWTIVLGKTEDNVLSRNYDFNHDSEVGARYLSYSVIY
jgi:hypothetical protein